MGGKIGEDDMYPNIVPRPVRLIFHTGSGVTETYDVTMRLSLNSIRRLKAKRRFKEDGTRHFVIEAFLPNA